MATSCNHGGSLDIGEREEMQQYLKPSKSSVYVVYT